MDKISKEIEKNTKGIKKILSYKDRQEKIKCVLKEVYRNEQLCTVDNLLARISYLDDGDSNTKDAEFSILSAICSAVLASSIVGPSANTIGEMLVTFLNLFQDQNFLNMAEKKPAVATFAIIVTLLVMGFLAVLLVIVIAACVKMPIKAIATIRKKDYVQSDVYKTVAYERSLIKQKLGDCSPVESSFMRTVGKISVQFTGNVEDIARVQHFIEDLKQVPEKIKS